MAKSFDKLGCLAYLCKTSNEAWYLSGILEVLQDVGVQIVILDGPEIYSECVPTRMWRTWRISFSLTVQLTFCVTAKLRVVSPDKISFVFYPSKVRSLRRQCCRIGEMKA